jgi:hypothetical protein
VDGNATALRRLFRPRPEELKPWPKKNIRKIKNAYIDGDPLDAVTPEILLDFGLHTKDPNRTDVPDPTEVVPFTLEGGEYLQVIIKHPACPE